MLPRADPLAWALLVANVLAVAAVAFITWSQLPPEAKPARLVPATFADLPGWATADPRAAASAFRRSCQVLATLPAATPLGWQGYAGTVSVWNAACKSLPAESAGAAQIRRYFETTFVPLEVTTPGHFTGYYEPELPGSLTPSPRFRVPLYGRPGDLVSADLGRFYKRLTGRKIWGRLDGTKLVPYDSRADIDAHGLPNAPVLLYTDDPVSAFFLQIQGSGRIRLPNGALLRASFAGLNGRPYTSIGKVLVARGALALKSVSLQTIRAWLASHPSQARSVLEADESFVFFKLEPVGDPSAGSPGTEGVPLTAGASLAVDDRFHFMGAPVYVVTSVPDADPAKPDAAFDRLLVAQDTGGDIKGPARGDIFLGSSGAAAAVAGRTNAVGRFFVLVPKSVAPASPMDLADASP